MIWGHDTDGPEKDEPLIGRQLQQLVNVFPQEFPGLAVGETETPDLSRMTFVVRGDDAELEQVRKQLGKVVTVVKVLDISSEDFVERDLMLIKVRATPAQRVEIAYLNEMFLGRTVDIGSESLMLEISGQERKIDAFIELMRPYGILELARTGRIALVRGTPPQREEP